MIDEQTNFQNACATLKNKAYELDKDFLFKINQVCDYTGKIPGFMIGILEDLDNGGSVLVYLANNKKIYKDIYKLPISEMNFKLRELSNKLKFL